MLTSVGRAAVCRVQTARLSSSAPSAAQLLCRQSAIKTALPIRSFTVSAWSPSPASGDKKAAKKTTTTTTKKATLTTKSKSKATDSKAKSQTKASAYQGTRVYLSVLIAYRTRTTFLPEHFS